MIRRLALFFLFLCLAVSGCACAPFGEEKPANQYVPYNYPLSEHIVLGEYTPLRLKRSDVAPTKEELAEQREADFVFLTHLTDRELAVGDRVNLNYTALFENEEHDDDTEAGFLITLGENALGIPGFDEGLIGATPGDSISLDLVFPDDYKQNPDYAGKAVSFVVRINYILTELPTLTDELVKKFTAYETVEAYEAGLAETLTKVKTVECAWQTVLDEATVLSYPEKEYENYYTEYLDGHKTLAASYDMSLSELVESTGMTMDAFYDEADEITKSYIKEDLVVYAIAEEQAITLSDEEYKQAVAAYYTASASDYYISAELMEQTLGKELLTQQFLSNKVLDFLCEQVVVTDD